MNDTEILRSRLDSEGNKELTKGEAMVMLHREDSPRIYVFWNGQIVRLYQASDIAKYLSLSLIWTAKETLGIRDYPAWYPIGKA